VGTILFKAWALTLHVPCKATAAARDLIAGRIDAMFVTLASRKAVQAGRLKALAVSAPNRASQLPNVDHQ
jgi:tripartite-type tricarboxylate transporter receptor subunit TctC